MLYEDIDEFWAASVRPNQIPAAARVMANAFGRRLHLVGLRGGRGAFAPYRGDQGPCHEEFYLIRPQEAV